MLPSGNDAAFCIAESIGLLLLFEDSEEPNRISEIEIINKKSR